MGITRRQFLQASAVGAVITGIGLPGYSFGGKRSDTVKIGFNAPLTGPTAAWGLPGLYGSEIVAEWINAKGGVKIGDKHYKIEIVSYDNVYQPDKALRGAKKLIMEEDVKMMMMLGGSTWPAVQGFCTRAKMLTTTLLPSDLNPNAPYHLAPAEVHPIYNVTGVEYLAEKFPKLKTVAMCAQEDELGLPSIATYRAAFEVNNMEIIKENIFDMSTTDFAPIVTSLLAKKPDILCLDTAYSDFVNLITQQAYQQGFQGKIISCTYDNYPEIIDKTSKEYMEGTIFQFPDFDDPALQRPNINFPRPKEFFDEFTKRHPGVWSAVAWEFPAILKMWKDSAERAGSIEPMNVLKEMKAGGKAPHVFGEANWWGKELWGIDNALVGNWPVVIIKDGKAKIVEYKNIPEWWARNKDVYIKHQEKLGLMYYQEG